MKMLKKNGKMQACSLGLVGLGIRLGLVLGTRLVLRLAMVLGLAQFFPRDALLSAVYAVVVCLCVRHTPVLYQNG